MVAAMATSSSQKKIQRVQQSGVSRRVGQRRAMAFPILVGTIIIVGLVLVLLARDARINVNGEVPRANQDAWYQAYGTYVCDQYLDNPSAPKSPSDISTPGNGLISVAPLSDKTAGSNATIDKFFTAVDFKVSDSSFTANDNKAHGAGDKCGDGKSATSKTAVKLFVWPPQASEVTKPKVITKDFGSVHFDQNKSIYALALVPNSVNKIPLPASVSTLDNPKSGIPVTTTTPAPTTTAAATTTSKPAATTTVAPTTTKK